MTVDFYVDGKFTIPDSWEPEEVGMIRLRDNPSHFVAVHIKPPWIKGEEDVPLAFILSLEQHVPTEYLSSADRSWKCTNNLANSDPAQADDHIGMKWFEEQFNDRDWLRADEIGKNGDEPWGVIEGINRQAKFVWMRGSDHTSGIYCRGYLSTYPDTLFLAGKNFDHFDVYNNGWHVGSSKGKATTQFSLPGAKRHLIAVHGRTTTKKTANGQPAFIASLQMPAPPGGVTSKKWRCKANLSPHEQEGNRWILVKFNDTEWPFARLVARHGDDPWSFVLDVSVHADWIWASSKSAQQIFCRSVPMSSEFYAKGGRQGLASQRHSAQNQMFSPLPIKQIEPEVLQVKEISAETDEMTAKKFLWDHLQKGIPFKLKGGIKHWPAMSKWTDDYLFDTIGHEKTHVTLSHNDSDVFFFYSEKRRMVQSTVGQFLQEYSSSSRKEKMYLAQHGIATEAGVINPALKDDFEVPEWSKTMKVDAINLWMGQGPQITPVHFDNVENLMFVVAGKKRFRLYEPAMSNFMYPVAHDRHHGITSRINDLEQPDLDRFPQATHLRPVFVDVNAGDVLYLPAYWWHHVTSFGRNVAVNMWFISHSSLLDDIYSAWVSRLPQSQWGKLRELENQQRDSEEDERKMDTRDDNAEHDEL